MRSASIRVVSDLLRCSEESEEPPSEFAFLDQLKACARRRDLRGGKLVHARVAQLGLWPNIYLSNTLINFYAKCGRMGDAREVFDCLMRSRTATSLSWNCIIRGYADNGENQLALELFDKMQGLPDEKTLVAAIGACACLASKDDSRWLEIGEAIHARAVVSDSFVESSLIRMYSKCGCMRQARRVFDEMISRDVVALTSLLHGYVENGKSEVALELFECEVRKGCGGCRMDSKAYVAALTACSRLATVINPSEIASVLERGKDVHSGAVMNCCCDKFVETAAIHMYGNCCSMRFARAVFDEMVCRDVVSWNVLLQGYVENGESDIALRIFDEMSCEGCSVLPDARTYITALTACAALAKEEECEKKIKSKWLEKGSAIHLQAVKQIGSMSISLELALVRMYSRCGDMLSARDVFDKMKIVDHDDVVSWNALLQGYLENGESEMVLEVFESMSCVPDGRSYSAALTACASLVANRKIDIILAKGKALHCLVISTNRYDAHVETALVNLYSKCGDPIRAQFVFDGMNRPDVVSWTCLVQGYIDNEQNEFALKLVKEMRTDHRIQPNLATFVSSLIACGNLLALESGRLLHMEILRRGLEMEGLLVNCLAEFYNKCGCLDVSMRLFDSCVMTARSVLMWNSLLSGCSARGDAELVLKLFEEMKALDVIPNEITFAHVLSACAHAGLSDQAKKQLELMRKSTTFAPNIIHYNCMVDLFARGGSVREAMKMAEEMPMTANGVTKTILQSKSLV